MNKKIIYIISPLIIVISILLFFTIRMTATTIIAQNGYFISKSTIDKSLLSKSNKIKNNVIYLQKMKEEDMIYSSLGRKYVIDNSNKQKYINTRYPIFSNEGLEIINTNKNNKLINSRFEEDDIPENYIISKNTLYDYQNHEQSSNDKYLFLKLENNTFINLSKIEIYTTEKKIIPVNSIINFNENYIRFYSYDKSKKLLLNQINTITNTTKVKLDSKEYNYVELYNRLYNIGKYDTDSDEEDLLIDDQPDNYLIKTKNDEKSDKYIKPVVKADKFNVYTYYIESNLSIYDPSHVITGGINFKLYINDKISGRKVFYQSGKIKIMGIIPNQEYKLVGSYQYYNEQKKKVESTFFEQNISTLDYKNLPPIKLSFENGNIYSSAIELKNIKITSDLNNEAIIGLKRGYLVIDNERYSISNELIRKLAAGKSIDYKSPEGITSNKEHNYEIILMDAYGNELNVTNNKSKSRTSKEKPTVSVKVLKSEITESTQSISLKNKDNVNITGYKYIVYSPNGTIVTEGNLDPNKNTQDINISKLNQNTTYIIKVIASYDTLDGNGTIYNDILGEAKFITKPISSLGYIKIDNYLQNMTSDSTEIYTSIDTEATASLLKDLLHEITVEVRDNHDKTVYTRKYSDEELEELKSGQKKMLLVEGLQSKTEYKIKYTSKIEFGSTYENVRTISSIESFKTRKKEAYVDIINQFVSSNVIDFDMRVVDEDKAILSDEAILEVRDGNKLVEVKRLNINDDYIQVEYSKIPEESEYNFKCYVDEYNTGYNNATYENNKVLYNENIKPDKESIFGKLELLDISRQVTGYNLFNIKDTNRIRKDGSGTGRKKYDINNNAIMFSGKNGVTAFSYYVPEAIGKKLHISFKAKYDRNSEHQAGIELINTYGNVTGTPLNLTKEYKEFTKDIYTTSGYIGFKISAPAEKNEETSIWIKDLSIIEISDNEFLDKTVSNYTDNSDEIIFTDTEIKSGKEIFPSYEDKSASIKGNSKDGYAIITDTEDSSKTKRFAYKSDQEDNRYSYDLIAGRKYKIELWGAAGGSHCGNNDPTLTYNGGRGAYTKGYITPEKNMTVYVYVGGKGSDAKPGNISPGGYNGGGKGEHDHSYGEGAAAEADGGGGGATDIRLKSGSWDNESSLKSRIMVAAGGGGASDLRKGGDAGALSSFNVESSKPATQIEGNGFGKGQDGVYHNNNPVAGGGGGYYGGYATWGGSYYNPASGGSSYISGHKGCIHYLDNYESIINLIEEENKKMYNDSKYSEENKFKANVKVTIENNKNFNIEDKYYIRIFKEGKEILTKEYDLINKKIVDKVNSYELEKNKNYTIVLSLKSRERFYNIDSINIKTDSEIRQISDIDELFSIHPSGKYVVVNDLDVRSINKYIAELYGEIDFQGHKLYVNADNRSYLIQYIRSGGVVKNIVIDYDDDGANNWLSPFVFKNYGTIDNIMLNVKTSKNIVNMGCGHICYINNGTIKNFIVNNEADIKIKNRFGLVGYNNYGTVENGYVYGKNINARYDSSPFRKDVGVLFGVIQSTSVIRNVYVLNSVDKNEQLSSEKVVGNLVGFAYSNSKVENAISIESEINTNIENQDPNIGGNEGHAISNIYYVSPRTYSGSKISKKVTIKTLHDKDFMNNLLNDQSKNFEVDKYIELGYYPQLKLNSCMPKQAWLELPKITDDDLIEVTSVEEIDSDDTSSTVNIHLTNKTAAKITEIGIASIEKTEILSQEDKNGKSTIKVKLSDPLEYKTSYNLSKIKVRETTGVEYTKNFNVPIDITMYYPISNITDWKRINNKPTENYILKNDLDFSGISENDIYISSFSGVLNGNKKKLKNMKIESKNGVIGDLKTKGIIKNIFIENYTKTGNTEYSGFINLARENTNIDNIHLKEINITNGKYAGAIVGFSKGNITNSSVTDLKYQTTSIATNLDASIGGIVGRGEAGYIKNCYVQNININVSNYISTIGVGGIAGSYKGSITNTYATGKIVNHSSVYTGGIVGNTEGSVNNSWTNVDIDTKLDYVGGIVGRSTTSSINNTLVLGNIYVSSNGDYVSRTSGNQNLFSTKNFYWDQQKVDGLINLNAVSEIPLSTELMKSKNTYYDLLEFNDIFDYEKIEEGILPKLKSIKGDILPNQVDNKLNEELLSIKEVEVGQTNDKYDVKIEIENPNKYKITDVEFDYLDYDNLKTSLSNIDENSTIITVYNVRPKSGSDGRYYDSYSIKTIKYQDNKETKKESFKNAKVELSFYKEISSVDEWKNITNYGENYRLTKDIDFEGIEYNNHNFIIGKLEGQNHIVKNINIKNITQSTSIFKKVSLRMRNIKFDNITIENNLNKSISDGINIINVNYGNLENIEFSNITLKSKNTNHVGIIGYNRAESVKNITVNNSNIVGNNNVAGLITSSTAKDMNNVTVTNTKVYGIGEYVGGIVAYRDFSSVTTWFNFTGDNLTVTGHNNVGGLFGYGGADYSTIKNSRITALIGCTRIGGIAATVQDEYAHYYSADNIEVTGYNSTYVGGLFAYTRDLRYANISNSRIYNSGNNNQNTGGVAAYREGYSLLYITANNITVDTTPGIRTQVSEDGTETQVSRGGVTSSSSSTGGLLGYSVGGAQYVSLTNITVKGIYNTGGVVGQSNIGRLSSIRINGNIEGTGSNTGGIYGKIIRTDSNSSMFSEVAHNIVLENSTVKGNNNVALFTGYTPGPLVKSFFYNIYLVGDVYSSGNMYGIVEPKDSTSSSIEPSLLPSVYAYRANKYVREGGSENATVDDLQFLSKYKDSQYIKLIAKDKMKDSFYYSNGTQVLTGFDYNAGQNLVTNGYYPAVNYCKEQIKVKYPTGSEITPNATTSSLGFYNMNSPVMLPNLNVYSSGINTINLEFDSYENTKMKLYEDNKLIYNDYVNKRLHTYTYNYKSTLKVVVTRGNNSKEYIIKPDELQNKVTTFKDKYAYIYNDELRGNIESTSKKYIHLYDKYALTDDLEVYDIEKNKKVSEKSKLDLEEQDSVPLFEFDIPDLNVKTYYNYSVIHQKTGDITYDNQIFYSNGQMEIIDKNTDNIKTTAIIDNTGNKNYVTILGKDGKIYDLKDEIKLPSNFKNSGIKYMSHNINNDSNIVVVMYDTGRVVVFDYRTGHEITTEKASKDISLFDYIKQNTQSEDISIFDSNKNSYAKGVELAKMLDEKPIDEDDNNNDSHKGIDNNYITYYNAVKDDYDVVNINEITNSNSDKVVSENDKIYSSNSFVEFYMKEKNITPKEDKVNVILLIGIALAGVLISLGIWFINAKKFKVKEIKI